MAELTLNELIDSAIDTMPIVRRRAYRRILTKAGKREEVSDLVASRMLDEPCCQCVYLSLICDSFTGDTAISISPENLKAILDFIVKVLPLLIQIFF